jgi:opacity protein-like surface antigen
MFNQLKIKSTIITTSVIACLSLQTIPQANASDLEGNVRILAGQKFLKSNDWQSMDKQDEFGVIFDIKKKEWPVSIAFDLFGSGADSDSNDLITKHGYTGEMHLGVRKIWDINDQFHPYIGGGLAIISAGFKQHDNVGSLKDDDSGTGAWLGTGAYWNVTPHFNLGFDVRYSEASVSVFNQDIKAGGTHFGLTFGYNW